MNPFDLRGPEFLLFYGAITVATWVALYWWARRGDATLRPRSRLTDPYRIAYLRGGTPEMARVAAVSLVDRKLLRADGEALVVNKGAEEVASHPLEQQVLSHFAWKRLASEVYASSAVEQIGGEHARVLERDGLLVDGAARAAHRRRVTAAVVALLAIAVVKAFVALARERHNLVLLLGVAAIASIVAATIPGPRVTPAGLQVLEDLRVLFRGLHQSAKRIAPGGRSQDATLLAAVYGVGALAALPAFAYAGQLFPRARASSSADGSSGGGCGASCGSSSSSGDGGSGCGGGCGGCGGD